jgi:3-hydroxybutyryl-CoA dehydrogenase
MERIGKVPVVMKRFVPGFIVNQIQNAYATPMFNLLGQDLADPEEIDKAVKYVLGIRLPIVGVVQSMDFNGLDTVNNILKRIKLDVPLIDKKVAEGHLGAKTSKGMFDYQGRREEEILKKRDILYLKMLDHLKNIKAFEPV